MPSFHVIVQRIDENLVSVSEHVKIRDQYPDEADRFRGNGIERDKNDPQYGYRRTDRTVELKTIVLEQTVEDLDLIAVIKAVNKIG